MTKSRTLPIGTVRIYTHLFPNPRHNPIATSASSAKKRPVKNAPRGCDHHRDTPLCIGRLPLIQCNEQVVSIQCVNRRRSALIVCALGWLYVYRCEKLRMYSLANGMVNSIYSARPKIRDIWDVRIYTLFQPEMA